MDIARQGYEEFKAQANEYTTPEEQETYQTTLQARAVYLELLTSLT
ncbi:MAG: hypothetical protein AAGA83_24265 [Cyanobacteria bacterium P01_F01_bin.116]